ncbi:hypothetical protein J437_LFUL008153 [Ladona fulva]|uniref:L-Fucosyltransferase n=1 Tax=Ladona fulva TaxID=123851 RepID=A0A8K0NS75_LADFU|nr:hypothetical protein J437_LFUL008153 [Ladona fulva]
MYLFRWVALPELVLPRLEALRAQEFRFHPYLIDLASSFLTAVKQHTGATVFVSIHVRRGDYDEYLHCKHNASLAPAAFYEEAMNRFRRYVKEKVAFIVISDDILWCRANIVTLRRDIFVAWDAVAGWKESTENLAGVPESDLALMAQCNHTVLDYGSFGTWGALLSGGRTITYGINGLLSTFVGETLKNWEVIPSEKFY